MSEEAKETKVLENYNKLKEDIGRLAGYKLHINEPWLVSLKAIKKESPHAASNFAHIGMTSSFISSISSSLISELPTQALQELIRDTKLDISKIKELATRLESDAIELISESDIADEAADFLTVSSYSQVISLELKEIGEEIGRGTDLNKIETILKSIKTKAKDSVDRLTEWAKTSMSRFMKSVSRFLGTVKRGMKEGLDLLLKKVAEDFQRFLGAFAGTLFSFAEYIQKVAKKRNFHLVKLNMEIPSFEASILMVGPVPVPIPKITTPKLTLEFSPG